MKVANRAGESAPQDVPKPPRVNRGLAGTARPDMKLVGVKDLHFRELGNWRVTRSHADANLQWHRQHTSDRLLDACSPWTDSQTT